MIGIETCKEINNIFLFIDVHIRFAEIISYDNNDDEDDYSNITPLPMESNYGGINYDLSNSNSEELIHVDDVNSLDITTESIDDEKFIDWLKNQKIIHSEKINIEHTRYIYIIDYNYLFIIY